MCQTTVTVDRQNNEEKNKMTVCNIIYKSSYKKKRMHYSRSHSTNNNDQSLR
jgi:hypothetical protein